MEFEAEIGDYINVFEDIKASTIATLGSAVSVIIHERPQSINTPLFLTEQFFVKGRRAEPDYGLIVDISYRHYDVLLNRSKPSYNHLFIKADLSRAVGRSISGLEIPQIDLSTPDYLHVIKRARVKIVEFLMAQKQVIVDTLLSEYLSGPKNAIRNRNV